VFFMPQVLTTNAIITCPHGGLGTTTPTDPKWTINGGFVVLENDPGVLACPFLIYPCVGYQLKSMGLNATQIDGRKVILVTDFNQSFTGLPLLMAETHQILDDSAPAPIPAGGTAPPLSPALADAIAPVVRVVPPTLAFNSVTSLPPTAIATFNLFSDFPLSWKLVVISEPVGGVRDITSAPFPPGLIVAPAGGVWDTPVLVVTVTMSAVFMASLGIGIHHFFMTGVNQRGLNSFAEMGLTVT
jgi:hypothetical protein